MTFTHLRCAALLALTVATAGPSLGAQTTTRWVATEDLRIDGEEVGLVPIRWLGVAKDGAILVSQPQDANIRVFDVAGKPAGNIGKKGQGPGEFLTIVASIGWVGDTLWTYDPQLKRMSFFSPQRKYVRSFNLLNAKPAPTDSAKYWTYPFFYPSAVNGKGSVLGRGDAGMRPQDKGATPKSMHWVRVSSAGFIERVIGDVADSHNSLNITIPNGFASAQVPFAGSDLYSVNQDGSRIVSIVPATSGANAKTFAVIVVDQNGDTVVSRRLPFAGVPIPKRMVDSALALFASKSVRFPEVKAAYAGTLVREKIPPFFPPIVAVQFGRDDTIWLGMYTATSQRTWLVLDARGVPIAQVELPVAVSVHVADRSQVWGVEKTADDVENIVRFRVKPR